MVLKSKTQPQKTPPRTPPPNISKIASLKKYPDHKQANDLLHQIAQLVAPIIHQNGFKVGLLCEMFPKDQRLLGLNVNRGAKILIRLRPHYDTSRFLPLDDLIGTFLHELTHNIHGPHDDKFYKYLDELKLKFELIQLNGAFKETGFLSEANRLGGSSSINDRENRIKKLSEIKYKAEVKRLGGNKPDRKKPLKELIREATTKRLRDNGWCNGNSNDIEPLDDELEIIEITDLQDNDGGVNDGFFDDFKKEFDKLKEENNTKELVKSKQENNSKKSNKSNHENNSSQIEPPKSNGITKRKIEKPRKLSKAAEAALKRLDITNSKRKVESLDKSSSKRKPPSVIEIVSDEDTEGDIIVID